MTDEDPQWGDKLAPVTIVEFSDFECPFQQRAGHTDFETTQRYIRIAEQVGEGFGDVFPPLPPELYESIAAREVLITSF